MRKIIVLIILTTLYSCSVTKKTFRDKTETKESVVDNSVTIVTEKTKIDTIIPPDTIKGKTSFENNVPAIIETENGTIEITVDMDHKMVKAKAINKPKSLKIDIEKTTEIKNDIKKNTLEKVNKINTEKKTIPNKLCYILLIIFLLVIWIFYKWFKP